MTFVSADVIEFIFSKPFLISFGVYYLVSGLVTVRLLRRAVLFDYLKWQMFFLGFFVLPVIGIPLAIDHLIHRGKTKSERIILPSVVID